ncbi:MAG: fibronectin type III domain-containing protein [Smithellaceae bacterium]
MIIRDGTYPGSSNILTQSQVPPSGTPTSYTIIKAEHDGGVVFPDGFLQMSNTAAQSYVQYEGLKSLSYTTISGASHVKFLRCAFTHNPATRNDDSTFTIVAGSYILVEDCWAWGAGRYKFLAGGSAHHLVFRRCVARMDRVNAVSPLAYFHAYTANQVAFENCIGIDGAHDEFWVSFEERGPVFYSHAGSQDTYVHGCMAFNNKTYFAGGAPASGFDVKQAAVWGAARFISTRNDQGYSSGNISNATVGNIRSTNSGFRDWSGYGIEMYNGPDNSINVSNSLFYDVQPNAVLNPYQTLSDYNVLYNNSINYSAANLPAGAHDYASQNSNAIDPIDGSPGNGTACLKYPVRVEEGSNCKGTGVGGADRGATILYRWGTSGTYWGDTGWDSVTAEPLWPWPNEARIRSDMRAYSYTGPMVSGQTGTLSGNRGFCSDGQTLTNYIWGYLNNPMPSLSSIYGSVTNQPPLANAGPDQVLVGVSSATLIVSLNGSASSDTDGTIVSYSWTEGGTQIATGVNPTVALGVGEHPIALIVTDNGGATASDDVIIKITAGTDSTPPVITTVQSSNITSNAATISWITDEGATSVLQYGQSSQYGLNVQNTSLVTSHSITISGLQASTTYHYQVASADQSANTATSPDYTFTTPPGSVNNTLQGFEDGVLWVSGGGQDPTGNRRGWAFTSPGAGDRIEIDNIGANGTSRSLKVTFSSANSAQIYFKSDDKITDHMPEAAGANRLSFYVRFPANFPIQTNPYPYNSWQFGTYIHDLNDWNNIAAATSESSTGIKHHYHKATIEQVGNGWIKYIFNTHPDRNNYDSNVPPDYGIPYYNNFGRFYFHFGSDASAPEPSRPFTIWIDEVKFYYDDGSVGGQVHDGGQNDAGFDGQFFPDGTLTPPQRIHLAP